jgi:hypothetical protein
MKHVAGFALTAALLAAALLWSETRHIDAPSAPNPSSISSPIVSVS